MDGLSGVPLRRRSGGGGRSGNGQQKENAPSQKQQVRAPRAGLWPSPVPITRGPVLPVLLILLLECAQCVEK